MSDPKGVLKGPGGFPLALYVHAPLDTSKYPYRGYETWDGAEDGDNVAVYELKRVFRVKHVKQIVQEPLEETPLADSWTKL